MEPPHRSELNSVYNEKEEEVMLMGTGRGWWQLMLMVASGYDYWPRMLWRKTMGLNTGAGERLWESEYWRKSQGGEGDDGCKQEEYPQEGSARRARQAVPDQSQPKIDRDTEVEVKFLIRSQNYCKGKWTKFREEKLVEGISLITWLGRSLR